MRGLLLLLLCVGATSLAAEYTFVVYGEGYDARKGTPLAEADVTAEFDESWGHEDKESFAAFKKKHGQLPKVKLSGEATTDDRGHFQLKLTFSAEGEGQLPVEGEAVWCSVFVYVNKEGFGRYKRRVRLKHEGGTYLDDVYLSPPATLKFQVVDESNAKPIAGLKIRITPRADNRSRERPVPPRPAFTLETDAKGMAELSEDECPVAQVMVTLEGSSFAWTAKSKARYSLEIKAGDNDWGVLTVLSGARLTFRGIDSDTREGVAVEARLYKTFPGSPLGSARASDGVIDLGTVPAGSYRLEVYPEEGWARLFPDVEVKAGEPCDLGDVALEPKRKLMVFAEDDHGNGLEYYDAKISFKSGELPFGLRHDNLRPFYLSSRLTAEACELDGLFAGTWDLVVNAEGFAPAAVEVQIPQQSVTVRLTSGGHIRAMQPGMTSPNRAHRAVAVRHGSRAQADLAQSTEMLDAAPETNPEYGLFRGSMMVGDVLVWNDLPAGTYELLGSGSAYGVIRLKSVEVKPGETTEVDLLPTSGVLTVFVTRKGRPASGETLYAYAFDRGRLNLTELTTDDSGVVRVESVETREVYVLPGDLHELVQAERDDRAREARCRRYVEYYAKVYAERTGSMFIEIEEDLCRLTIKFSDPELKNVSRVSVTPMQGEQSLDATVDGTTVVLQRVRKGRYLFSCSFWKPSTQWGNIIRWLDVTDSPEQTVVIETTAHPLLVSVEGLESTPLNQANIGVFLQDKAGLPTIAVAVTRADDKGKAEFNSIPRGDYELRAWVGRVPNEVVKAASQAISIKQKTSVTIRLDETAGALSIRFAPWNPPPGNSLQAARVEFLDEHGKATSIADPVYAKFEPASQHTVPSIPAGTWAVRVTRQGMLPYSADVVIESGKTAYLTVEPERAKCPYVQIDRFMHVGARPPEFSWTCEDDDGNQLDIELPNENTGVAFYEKEGLVLVLYNMPDDTARIILNVEGYKPASIEIGGPKTFMGRYLATLEPNRPGAGD